MMGEGKGDGEATGEATLTEAKSRSDRRENLTMFEGSALGLKFSGEGENHEKIRQLL